MVASKRRYWNNEAYVQDQTYDQNSKDRALERAAAMRRKGYKVRVLHEGYYYQVMVRDPGR